MAIEQRLPLYAQLEGLRGRPLIVYVTSPRSNIMGPSVGSMASDAIPELLDQLRVIPANTNRVDLLVVSLGGDATVAWRAMSLLRERFTRVAVLVPQAAYSAATLLALGADEIVMHPHGNLGPVDPQIRGKKKVPGTEQEVEVRFGYEELVSFLTFAREEAGLTDPQHVAQLLQLFCQEVSPVAVGIASRGSLLSISMGEKLLRMHMKGEARAAKARTIAESLNKKFFHHGYPVSRKEARDIGLKVAPDNVEVEELMWRIWEDIETELLVRRPFNPLAELAGNAVVAPLLFGPVPQVNLPANLPPQLLQAVLPQILGQIQVVAVPPVESRLVQAIMESPRLCSRSIAHLYIMAVRGTDLQIRINVSPTQTWWEGLPLPAE